MVELDTTQKYPQCSILDEHGKPLIWCYARTGGEAIHKMQEFVAAMRREKAGIKK